MSHSDPNGFWLWDCGREPGLKWKLGKTMGLQLIFRWGLCIIIICKNYSCLSGSKKIFIWVFATFSWVVDLGVPSGSDWTPSPYFEKLTDEFLHLLQTNPSKLPLSWWQTRLKLAIHCSAHQLNLGQFLLRAKLQVLIGRRHTGVRILHCD